MRTSLRGLAAGSILVITAAGLSACGDSSPTASGPTSVAVQSSSTATSSSPVPTKATSSTSSAQTPSRATTATTTPSRSSSPSTTTKKQQAAPAADGSCGMVDGMRVSKDAAFSCDFALNVMRANLKGGDLDHVYSPATGKTYKMLCQNLGGGGGPIRSNCVKADDTSAGYVYAVDPTTLDRK